MQNQLPKKDILDDSELLISEIQKRPALYNSENRFYNDKTLKEKLWTEVCEAVIENWQEQSIVEQSDTVKQVKRRWKSLRECFRRELQVLREPQVAGVRKKRKYLYYDQLQFLVGTYEDRRSIGKYAAPATDEGKDQRYEGTSKPFSADLDLPRIIKRPRNTPMDEDGEWYDGASDSLTSDSELPNITSLTPSIMLTCGEEKRGKEGASGSNTAHFESSSKKSKPRIALNFKEEEKVEDISKSNLVHLESTGRISKLQNKPIIKEEERIQNRTSEPIADHFEPSSGTSNLQQTPREPNKRFEEYLMDFMRNTAQQEIDEDRAFLLSLVPGLRKLSGDQKLQAKIEILQVMRRAQQMKILNFQPATDGQ